MRDPVMAADGRTYEREAIEEWLKSSDLSPSTNEKLPHKELMENFTVKCMINDWVQMQQQLMKVL